MGQSVFVMSANYNSVLLFFFKYPCISYLSIFLELEEVQTIATEIKTEFYKFVRSVSSRGIYMLTPFTTLSLIYHPIVHITVVCGVGM